MKAYKGFNQDMTCNGFQYEEGKEYETESAKLCESGFHACESPIDCLGYYSPNQSVYHEVELEDNGEREKDTKVVGKKIKIGARINIAGIIKATFDYVKSHCTNNNQGGYCSALQGGDWSALQGGDKSALQGGDWSALQGGDWSALQGGDWSALQGGNCSALQGGDWSALQGGNCSALQGGDWSVVYGGDGAKVKGGLHSVLAIQYWEGYELKCIKFKEVDGTKIKPDTWYKLDKLGRFIKAE